MGKMAELFRIEASKYLGYIKYKIMLKPIL